MVRRTLGSSPRINLSSVGKRRVSWPRFMAPFHGTGVSWIRDMNVDVGRSICVLRRRSQLSRFETCWALKRAPGCVAARDRDNLGPQSGKNSLRNHAPEPRSRQIQHQLGVVNEKMPVLSSNQSCGSKNEMARDGNLDRIGDAQRSCGRDG